jgi:hypothetical protein
LFAEAVTYATNSTSAVYWFQADNTSGRGISGLLDARDITQNFAAYNRDAVQLGLLGVGTLVDNANQKTSHGWSGGTQSAYLNGSGSSSSYNSIFAGINKLHLGFSEISVGSPRRADGHIRKIAYWPKRLSNTLLQQLTT